MVIPDWGQAEKEDGKGGRSALPNREEHKQPCILVKYTQDEKERGGGEVREGELGVSD